VAVDQQAVDNVARTFYSALAIAGCISSLGFVALALYGVTSESILRSQLFFAGLATTASGSESAAYVFSNMFGHMITCLEVPCAM
jgi:hypothetical protein